MNPLTKVMLVLLLGILVTMWWDYRFGLPLFVLIFILSRMAKVPKHWYKLLYAVWGAYSLFRIFYIAYGYSWVFKVYPKELMNIVLLRITPPNTPILGEIKFTVGGLLYLGMSLIQAGSFVLLIFIFFYTTSLADLSYALAKYGIPSPILFIILSLYHYVNIIQRRLLDLMNAQRLRGWELSKNPITALRRLAPLLVPLTMTSIDLIDKVTIAVRVRAFGAHRINPPRIIEWPTWEKVMIILLAIGVAVAMWAQFLSGYNIGYM